MRLGFEWSVLAMLALMTTVACSGPAEKVDEGAANEAGGGALRAQDEEGGAVDVVVRVEGGEQRTVVLELAGFSGLPPRTVLDEVSGACVFVTDGSLALPPQAKPGDTVDLSWRCSMGTTEQRIYHLGIVPGAVLVIRGTQPMQAAEGGPEPTAEPSWEALKRVDLPADSSITLRAAYGDAEPVPPAELPQHNR